MLDRRVFCRQAEGVETHRMQHVIAIHLLESGYHVTDGIVSNVSHVQLA